MKGIVMRCGLRTLVDRIEIVDLESLADLIAGDVFEGVERQQIVLARTPGLAGRERPPRFRSSTATSPATESPSRVTPSARINKPWSSGLGKGHDERVATARAWRRLDAPGAGIERLFSGRPDLQHAPGSHPSAAGRARHATPG